jgi:TonB family protein
MREFILILAISPLCVFAQPVTPPPPPELDRAVNQNPLRFSDRIAILPTDLNRLDADYSEEGRIAGLEGTVRLTAVVAEDGTATGIQVTEPPGLGLDEKAIEAIKQWRGRISLPSKAYLHADFRMPEKGHRWHLLSVVFDAPERASRPKFVSATYPPGPGLVGGDAVDHGQVLAALGRNAWVAIAFEINEKGIPVHFSLLNASDDIWGTQAIALIREWRFMPAAIEGKPVTTRCAVGLTWGVRNVDANLLAKLRASIKSSTLLSPGSEDAPRK